MNLLRYVAKFFNSHPHEEDDHNTITALYKQSFSTHILTRRMTTTRPVLYAFFIFSTHILTRRMTIHSERILKRIYFSTHILTRRMTQRLQIKYPVRSLFNSHPHEEDDDISKKGIHHSQFSTHILTRRMTRASCNRNTQGLFNSHPHEEDDQFLCTS